MKIEAPLRGDRASGRIELVDAVPCVALEQEQAGVAQFERPVAGAHDGHDVLAMLADAAASILSWATTTNALTANSEQLQPTGPSVARPVFS